MTEVLSFFKRGGAGGTVPVKVRAHAEPGIGISVDGLSQTAMYEAMLRIITAMQSCGITLSERRISVSLITQVPREYDTGLDLAIAAAILQEYGFAGGKAFMNHAQREQKRFHDTPVYYGELGLDGSVKAPIERAVQTAIAAFPDSWLYIGGKDMDYNYEEIWDGTTSILSLSDLFKARTDLFN